FGLWFRALALRSATEASAWLAAVPAFAAVIAWISLGSELTRLQFLGMGSIAAALFLQSQAARGRS
ncbi:MAG: EamA family transporter, partial [Halieaceae bacterium]